MSEPTRQLAAILFSDIVGYTALMGADEPKALEILHKSREIQKSLIESHKGKWLKEMGDGVLAQFSSAVDAVQCALKIQQRASVELEARIRIGIHIGDVTIENDDVFGDGVNIASRIQAIADPGGIYISESVNEAIHAHSEFKTMYLADVELKNVDRPIKVFWLQEDWLPTPSPNKIKELSTSSKRKTVFYIAGIIIILLLAFSGWWITRDDNKIRSIAVLPVNNFSGDSSKNILMAGIHTLLRDEIAKIGALRTISRRSTIKYRFEGMTIPEIAEELNVDAVIEPDVFKYADTVNIQVRLIKAVPEERELWSQSYNEPASDVFSIYDNIALSVADVTGIALTSEELARFTNVPKVNPEAHLDYLIGLFHWQRLSEEGLETALKYFKSALDKDPEDALGYAGIAMTLGAKLQMGHLPASKVLAEGLEAADKALELDSTLAAVHYTLALYGWWEWDFETADEEFQRTIEIGPNFTDALANYSHFLMAFGRPEESLVQIEKALSIEPANINFLTLYAMNLNNARRYDDAIDVINKANEIDFDYPMLLATQRTTYHLKGMYDEALKSWIQSYELKGDSAAVRVLQEGNNEGGYHQALSRTADLMVERVKDSIYVSEWSIGTLYTRANEEDKALDWLEKAYEEHDANLPYISCDPIFDPIQDNPRFMALLTKIGLTRNKEDR